MQSLQNTARNDNKNSPIFSLLPKRFLHVGVVVQGRGRARFLARKKFFLVFYPAGLRRRRMAFSVDVAAAAQVAQPSLSQPTDVPSNLLPLSLPLLFAPLPHSHTHAHEVGVWPVNSSIPRSPCGPSTCVSDLGEKGARLVIALPKVSKKGEMKEFRWKECDAQYHVSNPFCLSTNVNWIGHVQQYTNRLNQFFFASFIYFIIPSHSFATVLVAKRTTHECPCPPVRYVCGPLESSSPDDVDVDEDDLE